MVTANPPPARPHAHRLGVRENAGERFEEKMRRSQTAATGGADWELVIEDLSFVIADKLP